MNEETTDDIMDHDENTLGVTDPSELNFDTGNAVSIYVCGTLN